ncbi:MAG: hypothetical protein ABEJ31_13240 [Haloarculaceae archaeon]
MTTNRPTPASAVGSVLVGAVAVALVATGPGQRTALAVTLAGVAVAVGGVELRHRGHVLAGVLVAAVGAVVVAAGIGLGVARSPALSTTVELAPGLVGLTVLGLALAPLKRGRERLVLSVGTGLLVLSVVLSAAVYGSPTGTVVLAGVAVVLAWDLGEQAVNVGEQLGREARTWPVEALHGAGTAAVGGLGVGATFLVAGADVTGLSLAALGALLAAALTLTAALYN